MYSQVAWVLVSLGTQVQPQIILEPDYLPDYLSVSYNYAKNNFCSVCILGYLRSFMETQYWFSEIVSFV